MDKTAVLTLLRAHSSPFEEEQAFLRQTIAFVENNEDFYLRSNLQGHLTGSAWVCSPEGDRVLLIFHPKLRRWLQPGGHIEPEDHFVWDTARREALEECAATDLTLHATALFDLDVHQIPAKGDVPPHLHYDCRFGFTATGYADTRELEGVQWVALNSLFQPDTPLSLRRMAYKLDTIFNT